MNEQPSSDSTAPSPPDAEPQRASRALIIAASLSIGSTSLGVALAPSFLRIDSLFLALTSPYPHHLLLAAVDYPLALLFPLIGVRRLFDAWVLYRLGYTWGDRALDRMATRFSAIAQSAASLRGLFYKAAPVVVFVLPSSATYLLAGSVRMSARLYFSVAILSQSLWTLSSFWLGDWAKLALAPALAFIREHFLAATAVSLGVLGLAWMWRGFVRRRASKHARALDSNGGLDAPPS